MPVSLRGKGRDTATCPTHPELDLMVEGLKGSGVGRWRCEHREPRENTKRAVPKGCSHEGNCVHMLTARFSQSCDSNCTHRQQHLPTKELTLRH